MIDKFLNQFVIILLLTFIMSGQGAIAQTEDGMPIDDQQFVDMQTVNVQDGETQRLQLNNPLIDPANIASLFLTPNEQNLISDAVTGFLTRPPTEDEVESEQRKAQKPDAPVRPNSVREIGLGGILFTSSEDWTIWLNSQKITPNNIPPAIMDIQVSKDQIKLKWLDFQTNQIFPVKLRPHQRFNFDSRMFLPGASNISSNQ